MNSLIKLKLNISWNVIKKINLQHFSLASLASWYMGTCTFEDENGIQDWERGRCFLVDLLFYHVGEVHQALLSVLTVSHQTFLRHVNNRSKFKI